MSREMLFLCDVYDSWLDKNNLPHQCASDILYGENAMRLTGNQKILVREFHCYLGCYFGALLMLKSLFTHEQFRKNLKKSTLSSISMI